MQFDEATGEGSFLSKLEEYFARKKKGIQLSGKMPDAAAFLLPDGKYLHVPGLHTEAIGYLAELKDNPFDFPNDWNEHYAEKNWSHWMTKSKSIRVAIENDVENSKGRSEEPMISFQSYVEPSAEQLDRMEELIGANWGRKWTCLLEGPPNNSVHKGGASKEFDFAPDKEKLKTFFYKATHGGTEQIKRTHDVEPSWKKTREASGMRAEGKL